METAEDYIRQINDHFMPHHHNLSRKQREEVKSLIREIQKEAYNQALDDASENIEVDTYELDPLGDNGFILQKTLRLPLYTRGFNLIIVGKVELNKDSILKLKK